MSVGALDANIEVIPEPATLGLMGVAGLGMFLARRKARR
ncbi:PEP-CTERM sorting domain-containing protein [Pontiella sp.]